MPPSTSGVERVLGRLVGLIVPDRLIDLVVQELDRVWRRAVTKHLLTLRTPDGVLDLSEDGPVLAPGPLFPAELAATTDPAWMAFLGEYDRTGGAGRPSGARDWADLRDRMNYIVNLFRSHQQRPPFLLPPFTDDQVKAMQEGRVPSRQL